MADEKHAIPTPTDANTKTPDIDRAADDLELPEDKSKNVTGGACANGQHLPEGTIVVR
jgi:hypothetical protein